jgi:hypothetical protein
MEFLGTNTFSRTHPFHNVRMCCNRKQTFAALATSRHICQPFTWYQYCYDSNISHPEKLHPERKRAERLCMYPKTYTTAAFQRTALFKNIFPSSWYSIGPMPLIFTEN